MPDLPFPFRLPGPNLLSLYLVSLHLLSSHLILSSHLLPLHVLFIFIRSPYNPISTAPSIPPNLDHRPAAGLTSEHLTHLFLCATIINISPSNSLFLGKGTIVHTFTPLTLPIPHKLLRRSKCPVPLTYTTYY